MAPARRSVLVLLGFAASVHALPAGLQDRQIGLTPPGQSVSWESGDPQTTKAPEESEIPPIFSLKPSDQISLGTPTYSVSWETDTPKPTPAPEDLEYLAPGKPSDQFSIGQPSGWVSWDGESPPVSQTPTPAPVKSSSAPVSPKSSDKQSPTKKPVYPSSEPWPPKSISSTITTPKASSAPKPVSSPKPTPMPSPIPTPKPTPPKPSDQISLGPPNFTVSWDLEKRQDQVDAIVQNNAYATSLAKSTPTPKPTSKKPQSTSEKPKPISTKSTPSPTPTRTPTPTPKPSPSPSSAPIETEYEPPQPSDDIGIGPPRVSISWGKREAEAIATNIFDETTLIPPFPWPTMSVSWDKRDAAPQTDADTMGLHFPTASIFWPKPKPPTYISWGKRQDEAAPTLLPELPEDPDFPEEPEEPEGPIEIPPFPVPNPPNSIGIQPPTVSVGWGKREAAPATDTVGLQFPTGSVIWAKPTPPTYISWGKRQDEGLPTDIPIFPEPTPTDEMSNSPPTATVIWGRNAALEPTAAAELYTPTKPVPSLSCPAATVTLILICPPPNCPLQATPCDWNKPVPVMEKRIKEREIEKTIVTIKTSMPISYPNPTPTPSVVKCTPAVTKMVTKGCPTYTCVPWCDVAQVVR